MPRRPRTTPIGKTADDVQEFRRQLRQFVNTKDDQGRKWAGAQWGAYAFYDYDGEPIYVGQTNERLSGRIGRHLTNQRTDVVAMRILDPFEVAEVEVWPLWEWEGVKSTGPQRHRYAEAKAALNALEYSAYLSAIDGSKFDAILNEEVPAETERIELPPSRRDYVVSAENRKERGHQDIRIARRAETISRLAAVARERGMVTFGLRRVLVIQAVRLAYLSARQLAAVEGRPLPDHTAFDMDALVGQVKADPSGPVDEDDDDADEVEPDDDLIDDDAEGDEPSV